jgi:hypothetical protein
MGGTCGGTIWRTHKLTDHCGNVTTCEQVITIKDTIPPTVTCPADITVLHLTNVPGCATGFAQFVGLGGSGSDNCDSSLDYFCSDGTLVINGCSGTITRTHTVIDDCGNRASCTQVITVQEVTQVITALNCPDNLLPSAMLQASRRLCAVFADNQPISFYKVELNNVPPGYLVSNGTYNAWCVDYAGGLTTNAIYKPVSLYLSHAPLPPQHQNPNWDRVNYILNHKQGNSFDVQAAIWHFIGGPISSLDRRFLPLSAFALSMIADATANGAGFLPQPGQLSAVILDLGEDAQKNIIEIVCAPELQLCTRLMDYTLCATVTGPGPYTYEWTKDGVPIAGTNGACLTLTGLSTNDSGQYCIKVTGSCGGTASSCLTIQVSDCPAPAPRLVALDRLGGGEMEITLEGELGRNYLIEATEDFLRWRSIATVLNVNGKLRFTDPTPTSKCFYRLTMEP